MKVRILSGEGEACLRVSKLCMAIHWAVVRLTDPHCAYLGSFGKLRKVPEL